MRYIAPSELILNPDGSVFHLHLKPGEISNTIILVGDPARVDLVSSYFESIEFKRESREFVTITGKYNNNRVTVLSTGIGTDNIDIVINELDALVNIDFQKREEKINKTSLRLLRLGTTGAIQPEIKLGSMILSHYSIGFDGLLNWYAHRDRVTDQDMEQNFMQHMNWPIELPTPYFAKASDEMIELFSEKCVKGLTISAPGFYAPQGRVLRLELVIEDLLEKLETFRYKDLKITNFEMEGSALAGLSTHLGHKAATICVAIANRHFKESNPDYKVYVNDMIKFALERLF